MSQPANMRSPGPSILKDGTVVDEKKNKGQRMDDDMIASGNKEVDDGDDNEDEDEESVQRDVNEELVDVLLTQMLRDKSEEKVLERDLFEMEGDLDQAGGYEDGEDDSNDDEDGGDGECEGDQDHDP